MYKSEAGILVEIERKGHLYPCYLIVDNKKVSRTDLFGIRGQTFRPLGLRQWQWRRPPEVLPKSVVATAIVPWIQQDTNVVRTVRWKELTTGNDGVLLCLMNSGPPEGDA